MAAQQTTAAAAGSSPSAQVVGNAFVQQYYHILHQTPALVHRFYQESSKLGRPEDHGTMISVTSMQAINEKILSMDFHGAEIKTVDAQDSLNGGVLVLVTGYVTGKDNVRRDFTQSFFLAPQDKGFFVLNDIFRYVGEAEHQQGSQGLANGAGAPLSPEQDSPPQQEQHVPEHNVPPPEEEEEANEEEVSNPLDNGEGSVVEEEAPVGEVVDEAPNSSQAVVVDAASATIQEEAPKKSYASIVKVMKDSAAAFSAPTSASARPAPAKPERQAAPAPMPATAPDTPAVSSSAGEGSGVQEAEADGHSIYVKSLPLSATPEQLEEEFKRFGHIKPGGIQVRSHKLQGFCFGFVEFEEASAVQSAIAASPIMIGSRQVFVEEKRTNGSRVNNRGRFGPGRGVGFRNDGMRGRGSYGGGRGYGRGDFSNRPDFGGRGGSRGRGGDVGYQRVDYMGSNGGRGSRPGSSAVGSTKH
ncbi:nuclear transport factor 2-like [Phoenix dactylifera]|uniref:Nuclear transport factor 2-like n=1 Tax=Phoenix dactylifera TaxID=42345 RepID=A0A8B7BJ90_PHODC|nr:nuclear transport factor 2-like [Phoenix dactylifera]XP_038973186.1 nuclear transport factor 2-like [Phoenix dactylifera]